MAFTILGATLLEDAFLAWSKADAYEELLMMIAKDAGLWTSYYVTPFWKRGFWKYQSVCRKLKCLTQDIVQQCCNLCFWETGNLGKKVACGGPSCSEVGIKNNIFFEELNGSFKISEEPYGNLMGIIFHGSLSTASLINNIFMNLAMHQQTQDKIYSEVTMAQNGSMEEDHSNAHKMELMIFLVCPLKDFTLKNGETIPTGAGLVVPVELVMMDESTLGGAASEFNPYRFLSKAGNGSDIYQRKSCAGAAQNFVYQGESSFNLHDPDKSTAFLPFGSGVRACVGQKFVTEGVAMLFASLLRQYEDLFVCVRPDVEHTCARPSFLRQRRASTRADSSSVPDHFSSPVSPPNSSFLVRSILFEVLGDLAGKLEFGGLAGEGKCSGTLLESARVEARRRRQQTVANRGTCAL
ncbi:hypothetical protein ACLB2K_077350 [Fragaria x ananassa]